MGDKTLKILTVNKQIIQIIIQEIKFYIMKYAVQNSCEDLYSRNQINRDLRVLVYVPIGSQGVEMPRNELAESDNVLELGLRW